jgi:hypothetical protein
MNRCLTSLVLMAAWGLPAAAADPPPSLSDVLSRWAEKVRDQRDIQCNFRCASRNSFGERSEGGTSTLRGRDANCLRIDLNDDRGQPTAAYVWAEKSTHSFSYRQKTELVFDRSAVRTESHGSAFWRFLAGDVPVPLPATFLFAPEAGHGPGAQFDWELFRIDDWWIDLRSQSVPQSHRDGVEKVRLVLTRKTYEVRLIELLDRSGRVVSYEVVSLATNLRPSVTAESLFDGLPRDWDRIRSDDLLNPKGGGSTGKK